MSTILLIDAVVVLSLLVASRRRLESALPIFCFFLVLIPFESRFVIPGLFDLSTERVALLTLSILFFLRRRKHDKSRKPLPLKYLMTLHIGWALLSTCFSLAVSTSIKQLISQVIEYYLLYYILLNTITEKRTVYNIVFAMTTALGLCSIFGMFEAYASWSILTIFPSDLWVTYRRNDPLYIEWGRGLRVRSTFPHPILFGDALAMGIPLALYLLSVWKGTWQRCVLWLCTALMFWAVYKTSSRGPWLAVGMSSVLLFLLVQNRVRTYLLALGISAVVVIAARPGVWQTIANLYLSTQDSNNIVGASYEYRNALTASIAAALRSDPTRMLWGHGLGTFRELGLDIDFLGVSQHFHTCDNNWALFLYETGYVGVMLIGALLAKPLLMTLRNYHRLPRPERYLSGVFFISLTAFYFLLLSVAGYNWGQQGFMSWILISLSIIYPTLVLRDRRARTSAVSASSGVRQVMWSGRSALVGSVASDENHGPPSDKQ